MQAGTAQHVEELQHLIQQVAVAREALGEALGMVQDVQNSALDLGEMTASLAGSVRALFAAQNANLKDSFYIGQAMDHLRDILQKMQDVLSQEPQIEEAASTVAKILAILFPVFKALPEPVDLNKKIDNEAANAQTGPNPALNSFHHPRPSDEISERRSSRRVSIEADIGFASESNFFTGFSMDISSGGLFVATYDMPELGTPVALNFKLPNGPVLSVEGVVRWIREHNELTPDVAPGIGIKFENLSDADAATINRYMTDTPPLFYDEP